MRKFRGAGGEGGWRNPVTCAKIAVGVRAESSWRTWVKLWT